MPLASQHSQPHDTDCQAGRLAITHALTHLGTAPSVLIMNMGIWCGGQSAIDERVQMLRHVLQHAADLRKAEGLATRLLWKTTTATLKEAEVEEDWSKVRQGDCNACWAACEGRLMMICCMQHA